MSRALAPPRRFWAETKRVSNARAKAELGWRPMPIRPIERGYAAILQAEGEVGAERASAHSPIATMRAMFWGRDRR
jgi:hypothetical protein